MPLLASPVDAFAADPPQSAIPARYQAARTPTATIEEDPFRWEVTAADLGAAAKGRVEMTLVVPPGYRVYRDTVDVAVQSAGALRADAPSLPPGIPQKDPADPAVPREVYDRDAVVWIPVTTPYAPGLYFVHIEARYQGCRDGLCFPPVTRAFDVPVHVGPDGPARARDGRPHEEE